MNIGSVKITKKGVPALFMAPMSGYTDRPFRIIARMAGADATVTELASSDGLVRGNKTVDIIRLDDSERPSAVQLFGSKKDILVEAALKAQDEQKPDFIDLNAGCPVPKVVKKGAGSGLLLDPEKLEDILVAMKKVLRVPLTVKIRTGWNDSNDFEEILRHVVGSGIDALFIHARTKKQGYSGTADWSLIKKARDLFPNLVIIGNGDITSSAVAGKRLAESGCDGLMIGRKAFSHPLIFNETKKFLGIETTLGGRDVLDDPIRLFMHHANLIENEYGRDGKGLMFVRKALVNYASGIQSVREFRKWVYETDSFDSLIEGGVAFLGRKRGTT